MDTFQLRFMLMKFIKNTFIGVCASDELALFDKDEFAIISNVSKSNSPGTHWVCFFKSKQMNGVDFFDSSGNNVFIYNNYIKKFVRKFTGVKQCKTRLQPLHSNACGLYSLFFLVHRSKGISYESIIQMFSIRKLSENDKIVKKYFSVIEFPRFSNCSKFCEKSCIHNNMTSYCYQKNKKCFYVAKK